VIHAPEYLVDFPLYSTHLDKLVKRKFQEVALKNRVADSTYPAT
jgi:hypothetical protein